jgi:hypothetical protein
MISSINANLTTVCRRRIFFDNPAASRHFRRLNGWATSKIGLVNVSHHMKREILGNSQIWYSESDTGSFVTTHRFGNAVFDVTTKNGGSTACGLDGDGAAMTCGRCRMVMRRIQTLVGNHNRLTLVKTPEIPTPQLPPSTEGP